MATPLVADRTYSVYGWTKDNSFSTASLDFKGADLARLKPGEVLVDSVAVDGGRSKERAIAVSARGFQRAACQE